jgi:hypothetical protein
MRIRSASELAHDRRMHDQHQVRVVDRDTGTKSRNSATGLFGISDSLTVCAFDISSSV